MKGLSIAITSLVCIITFGGSGFHCVIPYDSLSTTTLTELCCQESECSFDLDNFDDGGIYSAINLPWVAQSLSENNDGTMQVPLSVTTDSAQGNYAIYYGFQLGTGIWQQGELHLDFVPKAPGYVNLLDYKGISFYAKGNNVSLKVMVGSRAVTDFSYYEKNVVGFSSTWTQYRIEFNELVDPGWGMTNAGVISLNESLKKSFKISLVSLGPSGTIGSLYIDDVKLIAPFKACPMNQYPPSTVYTGTTTSTLPPYIFANFEAGLLTSNSGGSVFHAAHHGDPYFNDIAFQTTPILVSGYNSAYSLSYTFAVKTGNNWQSSFVTITYGSGTFNALQYHTLHVSLKIPDPQPAAFDIHFDSPYYLPTNNWDTYFHRFNLGDLNANWKEVDIPLQIGVQGLRNWGANNTPLSTVLTYVSGLRFQFSDASYSNTITIDNIEFR